MNKIVDLFEVAGRVYFFQYNNWRMEKNPRVQEDRYEGYMRSDFSRHCATIPKFDSVEVLWRHA